MLGAAGGEAVSDEEGKEKKKPKVEVIEGMLPWVVVLLEPSRANYRVHVVLTGEENEDTRYSVRAKLYVLDAHNAYKERGLGLLKINVRKEDGSGARLGPNFPILVSRILTREYIVMRADAVHRLILNAALFNGMSVTTGPDPKYIKLASMEGGKAVNYAIRVSSFCVISYWGITDGGTIVFSLGHLKLPKISTTRSRTTSRQCVARRPHPQQKYNSKRASRLLDTWVVLAYTHLSPILFRSFGLYMGSPICTVANRLDLVIRF